MSARQASRERKALKALRRIQTGRMTAKDVKWLPGWLPRPAAPSK